MSNYFLPKLLPSVSFSRFHFVTSNVVKLHSNTKMSRNPPFMSFDHSITSNIVSRYVLTIVFYGISGHVVLTAPMGLKHNWFENSTTTKHIIARKLLILNLFIFKRFAGKPFPNQLKRITKRILKSGLYDNLHA